MALINMTLVLAEAYLGRSDEVRCTVEALGVHVARVLPEIGVITGSGEAGLLPRLTAMDAIEEARPEGAVRLPPLGPAPQ